MPSLSYFAACVVPLVLYSSVISTVHAFPRRLTIGGHSLALNGQAVRSKLFGMIDLYRIGLYLQQQTSDTSRIGPDAPKALRLEVLHDTRSRYLPEDWRDELLALLTPQDTERLRAAYAKIQAGDIVTISYIPGEGSRLAVNHSTILQSHGGELMRAFLDRWVGEDPVSADIKAALLGLAE